MARRDWQIHLSTVVLVVFVSGLLLGLNIHRRYETEVWGHLKEKPLIMPVWHYGWPSNMATVDLAGYKPMSESMDDYPHDWIRWDRIPPWYYWHGSALLINIGI